MLEKVTDEKVTIRDVGPWDRHPTVTNDAERVVATLHAGRVTGSRRLFYYDSEGRLDEINHDGRGHFIGFTPAARK